MKVLYALLAVVILLALSSITYAQCPGPNCCPNCPGGVCPSGLVGYAGYPSYQGYGYSYADQDRLRGLLILRGGNPYGYPYGRPWFRPWLWGGGYYGGGCGYGGPGVQVEVGGNRALRLF
jgi:hypothetical protein